MSSEVDWNLLLIRQGVETRKTWNEERSSKKRFNDLTSLLNF